MQLQRSYVLPLFVSLVLVLCGCTITADEDRGEAWGRSLAVLGAAPPRLEMLDPISLKPLRVHTLRSLSIDMAQDASGLLITAQCGGPGTSSDSALGLVFPAEEEVEYLATDAVDPEAVAFDDGWGLAIHGQMSDQGREGTIIRLESTGDVSASQVQLPAEVTHACIDGDVAWLLEEGPAGGRVTKIEAGGALSAGPSIESDVRALDTWGGRLFMVSVNESGSVLLSRDPGLGIGKGAEVAIDLDQRMIGRVQANEDWVVVAEYSWEDPEQMGDRVLVFDAGDLSYYGAVRGLPGPCALVLDAGDLWVACQKSSEVAHVDLKSLEIRASRAVGEAEFDLMDMELIGER